MNHKAATDLAFSLPSQSIMGGSKPTDCTFYSKKCTNGELTCIPDSDFKGPGGGSSKFYTTWSFFAILVVLIVVLPGAYITSDWLPNKWNNKLISGAFLAVLIGFAANSVGVGVTSQFLVTKGKPLVQTQNGELPLITQEWLKWFNELNSKVHLVPVLLSLFIIVMVGRLPWSGGSLELILPAVIIPVVFFFIWALVPIPKEKGSKEMTTPWNKASVVYNSPPFSIEAWLPICIFLVVVLTVCCVVKPGKGPGS